MQLPLYQWLIDEKKQSPLPRYNRKIKSFSI
ncbi:Uncharacterised protein [Photobacterium damselae]|nr:Uncharacterised protein [Photobacterium damselae]